MPPVPIRPLDPVDEYASGIVRTILAASLEIAPSGVGIAPRRLVNHLRGNVRPGDPDSPSACHGRIAAPSAWLHEVVDRLVEAEYFEPDERGSLILTSLGRRAIDGSERPGLDVLPPRARLGASPDAERELEKLRRRLAEEEGRPAFSILPNAALATIAARRPRTIAELSLVPGLGPARLERYGRRILHALRRCE